MNGLDVREYTAFSDEELVRMIQNSDDAAFQHLYERYLPKIRTMTYSFQGLGYDLEDLFQEATIGFFTAINVYHFGEAAFSTFCYICMRRMLVALIRQNHRKKALPQTSVIYTDESFFTYPAAENPEQDYIAKEDFNRLKERIRTELSQTEREVLNYYLSGFDYKEIAERLHIHRKSVDNALQRIRKKLR